MLQFLETCTISTVSSIKSVHAVTEIEVETIADTLGELHAVDLH